VTSRLIAREGESPREGEAQEGTGRRDDLTVASPRTDSRGEQGPEDGRKASQVLILGSVVASACGPPYRRENRPWEERQEGRTSPTRCRGSSGGEAPEGRNPTSVTGMKQAREAGEGRSRQEGEKPCRRKRSLASGRPGIVDFSCRMR